jgi:hypothetical protein
LVLGQEKVSAKSNEITAIPELLDALYLQGFLVSIDAMGCQRAIAGKIVAKGADYLLAVKGNQPALQQAIQTAFLDQKDAIIQAEQVLQGHGRVVAQRCSVLPANGDVETFEKALSDLNHELVGKSGILKHLRENLADLSPVVSAEGGEIDISPVARKLRDLSKGVDVSFTATGAQSFPLARHGMG